MPGCSSPPVTSASSRKRCAAGRVVGVVVEDLLQCHLAMQLRVQRDEDGAQAAPRMGPQDAEPLPVGRGRADGVGGGAVGVGIGLARSRTGADVGESSLDLAVAECGEALAGRSSGGNGGQALLGATAMFLLVEPDHRLDHAALVGVQVAAVDQVFRDLAALVATPGPEGGDELVLIDQAVLEGKQSKEEVAVRIDGGHGTDLLGVGQGARSPTMSSSDGAATRFGRIIA